MKQVTAKNHSLLEACECQTKDIGSVSGDGSSMRNKFGDSEIFMLQNLVHQECRNGVITENKLRKIYGDIFPMGSAVKYVQLIFKSMDQNGKGFVRCTDFIEFLCVSARGSRLERASLCFRICDVSGRGAISRADLGRVLDSVAELVGCGSLGRADTVIDRIFARVDTWLLMSSPWPTLGLCVLYYYLVRFAGPAFMKGRPAYDVQKLMFLYNFLQTLFSAWIFSRLSRFWLSGKYSWVCQPVDYSDSEDGVYMAATVWWYFFSKFTDFMDTFFMVVRHKYNQMTTLHVVHHAMMPVVVWLFLKFVGGGHSTFFMFLNIGVHVVMYFYYFMSSFGPQVQKYLWWKKYITSMQLVQFVTWSIHASTPLFMDCNYPKVYVAFLLFLGAFFFTLFTNFYIQSYVKKPAGEKSKNE